MLEEVTVRPVPRIEKGMKKFKKQTSISNWIIKNKHVTNLNPLVVVVGTREV